MIEQNNNHDDTKHNNADGEQHRQDRLFRSRNDRIIAGVCGGIAEFYGINSLSVRILFILLSLLNGIGLILYLVGVFLIPDNFEELMENDKNSSESDFVTKIRKETQNLAAHLRGKSLPGDTKDIFKAIIVILIAIVLLQFILPPFLMLISTDLILILAIILIAAHFIYHKK